MNYGKLYETLIAFSSRSPLKFSNSKNTCLGHKLKSQKYEITDFSGILLKMELELSVRLEGQSHSLWGISLPPHM